jgi:hypothetical protein
MTVALMKSVSDEKKGRRELLRDSEIGGNQAVDVRKGEACSLIC